MMEEASELIGLQVYTPTGVFLGNVNNLVIDLENKRVDGLFVGETNPLLVEDSKAVNVPFRWIQSIGDIILLKYFPKRVTTRKGAAAPAAKK
ncbi:MAG: PRC-barrel domain-containing protein [Methanomassiliicoccales archaeon]|nr:PRC-barrel domain-containing protein [Methanomassiliicoccales archaeon]